MKDEAEAVQVAKKYLSYFQGETKKWSAKEQSAIYSILPEDRRYAYDIKKIIATLADEDSVLELRSDFAKNMVTSFIRIAGKPMGLIANSTRHLGAQLTVMQPIKQRVFFNCAMPSTYPYSPFVTPQVLWLAQTTNKQLIRHASRLFLCAAALEVPIITILVRKAYGLGAMAMAGGSFTPPILA